MKNALLITLLTAVTLSCGPSQQTEETSSETTDSLMDYTEIDTIALSGDDSQLNFDQESENTNVWNMFKEYVLTKNVKEIEGLFAEDAELDAENVIELCSQEWCWQVMQETDYEDFVDSDYDGTPVKEFSVEETFETDGEEYGSATFLYFEERTDGLKLIGILAAG
ncbi:MAG: hypothetical protein ACI857_000299 [Arenicella sp.]|jgi:hypothetical protein